MFTRNWYKAIGFTVTSNSNVVFKRITGANTTAGSTINPSFNLSVEGGYYSNPTMLFMRTSFSDRSGVVIGTGTTPPTLDDYTLSGNIITGYAYNVAITKEIDEEGTTLKAVYTITNNNAEDITIGEIGLIASPINNNKTYMCLMERTVLESPVTIPPGGVGQITYIVKMVYPTE